MKLSCAAADRDMQAQAVTTWMERERGTSITIKIQSVRLSHRGHKYLNPIDTPATSTLATKSRSPPRK